jgi:nucleoside-diphosphate-sugar epimerase
MQVEPRFQWAETDDAHTADIVVRPPNERGNMSIARLQHDLDFAPKYDLAQGLRQYMQWIGEFE